MRADTAAFDELDARLSADVKPENAASAARPRKADGPSHRSHPTDAPLPSSRESLTSAYVPRGTDPGFSLPETDA